MNQLKLGIENMLHESKFRNFIVMHVDKEHRDEAIILHAKAQHAYACHVLSDPKSIAKIHSSYSNN